MKEGKIVLYSILLAIILFFGVWFFTPTPKFPNIPMPQNATKTLGIVDVFGLKLGQSTVEDAMRVFGSEAKVSLFKEKNKDNEVEVYFENTKIGGLSIRVIIGIQVDDAKLNILNENIDSHDIMPSGLEKVVFNTFANNTLLDETITHLSFIPRANLDDETIIKVFGTPSKKTKNAWYYPQKGLKIVKDEKLNIFEYTND
jgi:hypothetical protein